MDIEQERKDRFRFLHRLWDVTEGDEYKCPNMFAIGNALGFDRQKTERVYQYLNGEGLAESKALGGVIGITHDGIREVENALSQPEEPTHYFPAVNVISIGSMSKSTIQQASPGAVQQVKLEEAEVQETRALVQEIKSQLDQFELSPEDRQQVEAEVSTIEAQLGSPKPRRTAIAECLASLRTILERAAAGVLAAPIVAKIAALLAS